MSTSTMNNEVETTNDVDQVKNNEIDQKQASILSLPNEVLEMIIMNDDLDIRDIINLGLACKQLHEDVFFNSKIWAIKILKAKKNDLLSKKIKMIQTFMVNLNDYNDEYDEYEDYEYYGYGGDYSEDDDLFF